MIQSAIKSLVFILVVSTLMSCGGYNAVLKNPDPDYKFQRAVEYFEDEQFYKSFTILEELINVFRGTTKAQEVYYYYAKAQMGMGDYILAAYHLKNFVNTFPRSEYAEECAYLAAYCYYEDSPQYSLDQSSTYKAIDELQLFIDQHPNSDLVDDCTELIEKLRLKLERKSFEQAKLYYETENYKSAIIAFDITINDFPDTKYREEALYLQLESYYLLAMNSIDEKKQIRLKETVSSYKRFARNFPESEFLKEAAIINRKAEQELDKLEL